MPEPADLAEVIAAWRSQPTEGEPRIAIEQLRRERTSELFVKTRGEILSSVGAALLFAAVLAWRFGPEPEGLIHLGCSLVALWAVFTVVRFRRQIWPKAPEAGSLARPGLEHYRSELKRRRQHLRNAWIWHGPLGLACLLSGVMLSHRIVPGRLWQALPLFLLLAVWAVIGVIRRFRHAAALQQEIDEVESQPGKEPLL